MPPLEHKSRCIKATIHMSLAVTQTLTMQGLTENLFVLSKYLCRQCYSVKKMKLLVNLTDPYCTFQ